MSDRAAAYQAWVDANVPDQCAGLCVDITTQMQAAFPELRRVRGHFICPLNGDISHWWLETADGQVVDPTGHQFAYAGGYREYTGPEPTGQCLDCGALLFNRGTFCNEECARSSFEFIKSGGTISVNGIEL